MKSGVVFVVTITTALALIVIPITILLSIGVPVTPHITIIATTPTGKPIANAYVQVFAMLPPGTNKSLMPVWNGTTNSLGQAYIPLTAIAPIAQEWINKGFSSYGVGLEIVISYVNGSTLYSSFQAITYNPADVIRAVTFQVPFESYASVTAKLMKIGTVDPPTPPGQPEYPLCWWNLVWNYQTSPTYIPIIFAVNQYTSNSQFGGAVFASLITGSFYFYGSAEFTEYSEFEYQVLGVTLKEPVYYTYTNDPFFSNWPVAVIYVQGTLGAAEFVDSCNSNYYANEAYVQSSNASNLYTSHEVGTDYLSNALDILENTVGISIVPFDEYDITYSTPSYEYSFVSLQEYSQEYPFLFTIPVGALLKALEIESPEIFTVNASGLFSWVETQTISIVYNTLLLSTIPQPSPGELIYGDVLGLAANVQYQYNGYTFSPILTGFYVDPPGSYTASTNITVSGPDTVSAPTCLPPPTITYYINVYIGNTPYLVPSGTITYYVYNEVNGQLVTSGTINVPFHETAQLSITLTPGEYELVFYYDGYTTKEGTITFQSSGPAVIYTDVVASPCH